MPVVKNKYRDEWEPGDVDIMRPGPYGNLWRVGPDGTRKQVLDRYETWLMAPENHEYRDMVRRQLRGRNLTCCCKPQPCHGDLLMKVANSKNDAELGIIARP